LKTALGSESGGVTNRLQEQMGYAYDSAGNLFRRTNNALVDTFNVNDLNELTTSTHAGTLTVAGTTTSAATNVTVNGLAASLYQDATFAKDGFTVTNGNNSFRAVAGDSLGRRDSSTVSVNLPATVIFSYDLNGNLLSDGTRAFDYDDENQLIRITVTNAWKSEFTYDGKLRRRVRREFTWRGSAWVQTNEVRYVYDGNLVVQERDAYNLPQVTYTRGNDLSGSLEGAGGIGGLLARSDINGACFYHADGNGNITALVNGLQLIAAKYLYDPFGNILSQSGPLADANLYRFSSKEWHLNSGLVYYLYRFYDGNLQRWVNRDPVEEEGGLNLQAFIWNDGVDLYDPFGLSGIITINTLKGGGGSLDGHAWITYTPDGGETVSFGTYGNRNPTGLYTNLELQSGYPAPDVSRSMHLNDIQEQNLFQAISQTQEAGSLGWNYTSPCTTFAANAWSAATGEGLYTGVLNSPSTLANSINNANWYHSPPTGNVTLTIPVSPTQNISVNTAVVFIRAH
jgi:RHS repeat-associated protein